MEDLYEGEMITTWRDEELVFITIYLNGITISILEDDFPKLVNELVRTATKLSELEELKAS